MVFVYRVSCIVYRDSGFFRARSISMKILITGGAGFIGHHVARMLAEKAEIVVLDDLSSGRPERLNSIPCRLIQAHMEDLKAVIEAAQGCDGIIHLAAFMNVAESIDRPTACFESNILGMLHALEASRVQEKKPHVIFASSSAVYGRADSHVQSEETPCVPRSAYGASKLHAEKLGQFYHEAYGVPVSILRFFNVYGPGQSADGAYAAVIPRWMAQAARGEPLVLFGDGSQTRDFVHVNDVVRAIEFLIRMPEAAGPFNVGTNKAISMTDLAQRILRVTKSRSQILYQPARTGEVVHSCADITRLRALGFTPKVTLQDGLAELEQFRFEKY